MQQPEHDTPPTRSLPRGERKRPVQRALVGVARALAHSWFWMECLRDGVRAVPNRVSWWWRLVLRHRARAGAAMRRVPHLGEGIAVALFLAAVVAIAVPNLRAHGSAPSALQAEASTNETTASDGSDIRATSESNTATLIARGPTRREAEEESMARHLAREGDRGLRITATRGDTLSKILRTSGINGAETEAAIASLREVYDPKTLRAGETVVLHATSRDRSHLARLYLEPRPSVRFVVERTSAGAFQSKQVDRVLAVRDHWAEGEISSSLFVSARKAGVPLPVLAKMIQVFSFTVDFQRDIHPGDRFSLFYESWENEQGEAVDYGNLLYGELVLQGKRRVAWSYETHDEGPEYFDNAGRSVRKGLLRTPLDGARLSSGFGMRRHPILGYNRMHRGLDFAAPRGTPVYAAGNGTVEAAGRNGGYGRYIRIRHSGSYKTAYAHLHRISKGVQRGARVAQGDVIGMVGSTGNSTGPHLHYEVILEGRQVNPRKIDLPSGRILKDDGLLAFRNHISTIFARIQRARGDSRVASLEQCGEILLRCGSALE